MPPARSQLVSKPARPTRSSTASGPPSSPRRPASRSRLIQSRTTTSGSNLRSTRYLGPGGSTSTSRTRPWLPEFAQKGFIVDLTDKIDPKDKADFAGRALETVSWGGRLYALPIIVHNCAMYYRSDLLDAVGLKAGPATWDEYREFAKKLTKDSVFGRMIARGGVSVHLMAQLPHEVEACAHLVRDQERKPHSSPSELIGRNQCAFRFGAQSPMRSDSMLGRRPRSWRCVRANAPPNRRRRRGGEQVRQPQSQFSRSARAGDATTAASLTL